jgi:glycine cleavage system H protein
VSDYPSENRYTKDHEWIAVEGEIATIGITDYAQGELGDIIFIELPEPGTYMSKGDPFGTVEAVKTVEEIYAPVTGEVIEINGDLEDRPELVNQSAFDEGWLVRIKMSDPSELEEQMDDESYLAMVGE